MRAPNIAVTEALAIELSNIAASMQDTATARAPGEDGAAVVRVLEAASRSLQHGGALVQVEGD